MCDAQLVAGCEVLERELSVLFPVREGRFQVMHKSVADWLRDCERKSMYVIDEENIRTAHRRMVCGRQQQSKEKERATLLLSLIFSNLPVSFASSSSSSSSSSSLPSLSLLFM